MNSEVEVQNDIPLEEAKNEVPTKPEEEIKSVADPLLDTRDKEQSASGDPAESEAQPETVAAELSSSELPPETKEVVPPGLSRTDPGKPEGAAGAPRPRRFALLAASMTLAAEIGGGGGSFGAVMLSQFVAPASMPKVAPQPAFSEHADDVRALAEAVNGLRANLKAVSENVSALRLAETTFNTNSAGQLTKILESAEKIEHKQAERHATATALVTKRSIAPTAETTARPRAVEGWVLRKAVRDIALVQSRDGIIEVQAGDHLLLARLGGERLPGVAIDLLLLLE